MKQDQLSGAAADAWGRKTARAIASELGAEMKSQTSNEDARRLEVLVPATMADAQSSGSGQQSPESSKLDGVAFGNEDAQSN